MAYISPSTTSVESEIIEDVEELHLDDESSAEIHNVIDDLPFIPIAAMGETKGIGAVHMGEGKMCFAASHYPVIQNYEENYQKVLIGHKNCISTMASDPEKKFLVTADAGLWEPVVYVWKTGLWTDPVAKFKAPSHFGTRFVAISQDARYLITVSEGLRLAVVHLWVLFLGKASSEPAAKMVLAEEYGRARHVTFSPDCTEFAALTCSRGVIFLNWTNNHWKFYPPPSFVPQYGRFVCSLFMAGTGRAATVTLRGNVVIWAEKHSKGIPINEKVNVDIKKLERMPLTIITETDRVVVIGNQLGQIRFYSQDFTTLLLWFIEEEAKPIISLSFGTEPVEPLQPGERLDIPLFKAGSPVSFPSVPINRGPLNVDPQLIRDSKSLLKQLMGPVDLNTQPNDASPPPDLRFTPRDLILNTESGRIVLISFKYRRTVVLKNASIPITCGTTHPTLPRLYLATTNGDVRLMNYEKNMRVLRSVLWHSPISSMRISPDGVTLVVGTADGTVMFLHPILMQTGPGHRDRLHRHSASSVIKPIFSNDSQFLAHWDGEGFVSAYRCLDKPRGQWLFLGRKKSHQTGVIDLLFSQASNGGPLYSLGADRLLIEYDIEHSTGDTLQIKRIDRVQMSMNCRAMCWCPTPEALGHGILISFSEYMMYVITIKERACVYHPNGPLFPTPVNMLVNMGAYSKRPNGCEGDTCAICITNNYAGLLQFPPEGNPYHSIGMFGHPGKISMAVLSGDKQYLFLAGKDDTSVIVHKVNTRSLEKRVEASPQGIEAYLEHIPGGRTGWAFKELIDAFCYAQLMHQGIDTKKERFVSNEAPLCELPDLIRAAGVFPPQIAFKYLRQVVAMKGISTTGVPSSTVSFEEYIKIIHNFTRGRGVTLSLIKKAFDVVAHASDEEEAYISRNRFLNILMEKGDPISQDELRYILTVLVGEDIALAGEADPESASFFDEQLEREKIFSFLPENITFPYLMETLLGVTLKDSPGH